MKESDAIIAVLCYHDIFSFPLTLDEIYKFLPLTSPLPRIKKTINILIEANTIGQKGQYYFLKKRDSIVKTRQVRQKISQGKLKKAKLYANFLRIIPTVKLVGISGALAMQNSTKSDDIDFIIITQKNLLWTTRFLVNAILLPFKRNPQSKKQSNLACLNLFLDESDLKIKDENLYTAHEVAQVRVLWVRSNIYQKFLKSNSWIRQYLPNWQPSEIKSLKSTGKQKSKPPTVNRQPSTIEFLAKKIQLFYMRSKITTEIIGDRQLFFHPKNNQSKIISIYVRKLKALKIQIS